MRTWRPWPDHRRSELLPFDEFDLIAAGFRKNKLGRWSLGRPMAEGVRRVLDETVHAVEATPRASRCRGFADPPTSESLRRRVLVLLATSNGKWATKGRPT
jgi:hypothetical protein